MPTRHGVVAAAIVTLILPCGLILRRQIAVRIAHAIARAQIPAMAAWRRMDGDTVLHGLRQSGLRLDRCNSTSRHHAQLNGQCCSGNADDHGPSPIKPEAADALANRPITIEGLLLRPSEYIKTGPEYPMNAFQEVKSLQRSPLHISAGRRTAAQRRRAIAFRSSRFADSDSPGGHPDTAVAPCPSGSRGHREYRGLPRDRMVPAAGRRRTPGDNTGPIETAAAPSRSGSTCRPAHRDRSRGRMVADGRDGDSGFPGPRFPGPRFPGPTSWPKEMLSFRG